MKLYYSLEAYVFALDILIKSNFNTSRAGFVAPEFVAPDLVCQAC